MFGKYLKCLIAFLLSISYPSFMLASGGGSQTAPEPAKKTEPEPKAIPETPKPVELEVNGYRVVGAEKNQIIGLRFKGIGDWLFNKKAYSRAIKYYENAFRYLPNEADVYFKLGEIYFIEKIYYFASEYYRLAIEKYAYPENFGKSKKYTYLAQIGEGLSLYRSEQIEKAQKIASELSKEENSIKVNYPDVFTKLQYFYREVWGEYGKPHTY